jgi:hypothetical protein
MGRSAWQRDRHDWRAGDYSGFALSHDESRVAAVAGPPPVDIVLINLSNGVRTPFTFEPVSQFLPVWSANDRFLAYAEENGGLSGGCRTARVEPADPPGGPASRRSVGSDG